MATLLQLRTKLNGEIGVATDAEAAPWSVTTRNNAISDGYAALWRVGVWKPVTVDIAATGLRAYAVTGMRRLNRAELLDSSGGLIERTAAYIEPDGAGGYQVLVPEISTGYTLRLYGWTAYVSTFANDAASDDLEAEYNRIPLLKAKAILYRAQLASFARYGERQAVAPQMNLTVDQLLGVIAACEREFADEAGVLAGLRLRGGNVVRVP